jgi:sulfonate transport system substrate-binding protein
MMRLMKFPRGLLAILVLLFILVYPNASRAQKQTAVIRIGLPSAVASNGKPAGTLLTELTNKFLHQQLDPIGAKYQWIYVGSSAGPGINEAFASGAIDFAYYGDLPAIVGLAGGLKYKLIVPGTRGNDSYLIVSPNSTAKSISDLKGERVAIHHGRPWNLAFARLLLDNSLSENDFHIFNLTPADSDAALASQNIDAVYAPEGYLLEERGVGKIIWSTRPEPLDWKYTAELWVADSFASKYPDVTERIAKAYVQLAYYISRPEHREEILRASVAAGTSYQVLVKEYTGIPLKNHWVPLVDPFLREHYRYAVTYSLKTKLIRRELSVDDIIDSRFDQQALKDLQLTNYWPPAAAPGGIPQAASGQARAAK